MHDAIVIGSDPNALVCAALLARAGKRVLVVEPGARLGGIAATQDIVPGFRAPVRSPAFDVIAPAIVDELALGKHGLELAREHPQATLTVPQPDGPALELFADVERSRAAIAKHSKADAEKWPAFCARMAKLAGFLGTLYDRPPPRLMAEGLGEMWPLAAIGLRLRRLGKADMIELLRILPLSARDLLDDWFESPLVQAAIGACAVDDLRQGPRSAGTGFVLLHHLVGRAPGAFRARTIAKGDLVDALVAAAKSCGVELRTGKPVRVQTKAGRACGVVFGDDELPARRVISGFDARRTLLELVDPTELAPEVVHATRHIKHRGVRAMLSLALDDLPDPPHGVLQVGAHLDDIERAYDDAKHGGISKHPLLLATVPSLADPSLAPAGKHVMTIAVQYAPFALRDERGAQAWDDAARALLVERVVDRLASHVPGIRDRIRGHRLHTPVELAHDFGLAEGHMGGGELLLDQILFMRPLAGFAEYASPLRDLWLCGDATHPGAALPGMAGRNAARRILQDRS
ncbi:MAG TPA: NAD(P)/FAD-dependent oxidoreductase [Nannocystaceae bacterium]|nr:NAD(P)/FAD-dependent oxidoreductase [Nannocystaceae bacterium]